MDQIETTIHLSLLASEDKIALDTAGKQERICWVLGTKGWIFPICVEVWTNLLFISHFLLSLTFQLDWRRLFPITRRVRRHRSSSNSQSPFPVCYSLHHYYYLFCLVLLCYFVFGVPFLACSCSWCRYSVYLKVVFGCIYVFAWLRFLIIIIIYLFINIVQVCFLAWGHLHLPLSTSWKRTQMR